MQPTEPTVEDMEECLQSLELDEMFERDETIKLMLEEEEAERDRKEYPRGPWDSTKKLYRWF